MFRLFGAKPPITSASHINRPQRRAVSSISPSLTHLKSAIHPSFSECLDLNQMQVAGTAIVHQRLDLEYRESAFAMPILNAAEYLIKSGKIAIHQSLSLDEDMDTMAEMGECLFIYNTLSKQIYIPSDLSAPYMLMPFLKEPQHNFHVDQEGYFSGAIIHECTHAVDDFADLFTTVQDRERISKCTQLISGLDFDDYEKPELRALQQAFKQDKAELVTIANTDVTAKYLLSHLEFMELGLKKADFLDEIKSYLVEFSTTGAFGAERVQRYLPRTSEWFFNQFVPVLERKVELANDADENRPSMRR